jgi:hypothetical protein
MTTSPAAPRPGSRQTPRRTTGPRTRPVRPAPPPDPARSWIAEIEWREAAGHARFRATARATRDVEPAVVAESAALAWPPEDRAGVRAMTRAALEVEQRLLEAGWRPIEPGRRWYAKRFAWVAREHAAPAIRPPPERLREARARMVGRRARLPGPSRRLELAVVAGVVLAGGALRVWQIDAVGLNSDEAVYAGQGASIAGVPELEPYFPTFRAHPLLFQTFVSFGFELGSPEVFGRLLAAGFGLGTVLVTWRLARLLYGRRAGVIAALVLALMPYHVVVSRQILLDGPMVFWSTVTLYLLARYALTQRPIWFHATAAGMALTFLSKEASVILLGAVYAFLALTPSIRIRAWTLAGGMLVFAAIVSAFPLALMIAGQTRTGGNFLTWQLLRRANHEFLFYPTVVPLAMGPLVVLAACLGLWRLRRHASWRETLLLSWIAVPAAFLQMLPIKGFQYLLPAAPAVAVLAARFLARWPDRVALPRGLEGLRRPWVAPLTIAAVAATLALPAWTDVQPSKASTFLAGSGGVPGGREAGRWIARNVPEGARMMSVGPSMANILQYYGHRKVYGLAVSPNPLHRNPVYEAMRNPDRLIRDNELQYVVWDAFSAQRSPFFSRSLTGYVERYHGTVAHAETVPATTRDGATTRKPIIVIYEVRP